MILSSMTHIILTPLIANYRQFLFFFPDSCNSCDSCSFKKFANSQIRDKKSVPGWLFCEAFFYSKNWSLFLFMKGVARPCRALEGHGCNRECLHSQRHPGHSSSWCSAPTPFIKFFFSYQSTQTQHMPSLSRNGKPTLIKVVLTQKNTVMA